MRSVLRALIPSMFHRRLLLLAAGGVLAFSCLLLRTAQITVARHERSLESARAALVERRWTPTVRGRILDRKDRVLAVDRPSFAVAVEFSVLEGRWQAETARRLARRQHGSGWSTLPDSDRDAAIAGFRERLDDLVGSMWARVAAESGASVEDLRARSEAVIARVERAHASVTEARKVNLLRDLAEAGRPVTAEQRDAVLARAAAPILEQRSAHVVVDSLPDEAGFALIRLDSEEVLFGSAPDGEPLLVDALPGLEVIDTASRSRPFDEVIVRVDRSHLPGPLRGEGFESVTVRGVASHVIGDVRHGAQAEDIAGRREFLARGEGASAEALTGSGIDRGRYLPTDLVGQRGLEDTFEHRLRGLRGVEERDRVTQAEVVARATPGRDVRTTIDVMLQARVQAAMDPALGLTRIQPWHGLSEADLGTTRNGAAVVLDVETGEVLAMVSTPTPADDVPEGDGWRPDPWVNRAIAAPYPPGSIAKALILPEASRRGVLAPGRGVVCTGHLLPDRPDLYRCWIYKQFNLTHSPTGDPVMPSTAIAVSCNIFFYEMGRRLGAAEVADVFADFGVGEAFSLGIGPEWPGAVGSPTEPGVHAERLASTDGILLAIGQGPVSWTPLHAADAYATLARGGVRIAPRLVRDGAPPSVRTVALNDRAVRETLDGLRLSLAEGGTGHSIRFDERREAIFDAPGVDLWGKTGTATAPPIVADPDGPGPRTPRTVREGDHAWFVVLAGAAGGKPEYACAVMIEYAGSGGKVAGPVMNQVVHALIEEGYLPSSDASKPVAGGVTR